jgi:hypothetical protein
MSDGDTLEVDDANDGVLVDHREEKAARVLSSCKRKRPADKEEILPRDAKKRS